MNIFINIIIYLILFVSLLIILRHIIRYYDGFQYKINNDTDECNSKNCPVTKSQNDIYKLHVEFKPLRDKNHMISYNKMGSNFFYKSKGPENIFIIRHGEKIKSKYALDCNGILRSTYIPELIETLNEKGFGINYIITAYDYNSMHQQQTVSLTSWLFNIPIFMYGDQTQTENAVNEIFNNPYFDGKNVLL